MVAVCCCLLFGGVSWVLLGLVVSILVAWLLFAGYVRFCVLRVWLCVAICCGLWFVFGLVLLSVCGLQFSEFLGWCYSCLDFRVVCFFRLDVFWFWFACCVWVCLALCVGILVLNCFSLHSCMLEALLCCVCVVGFALVFSFWMLLC